MAEKVTQRARQSELEQYQRYIRKRLQSITPVFAKAAVGDFSGNVRIPEQEDELTEFFVGVQIVLEAIREKVTELETTVKDLQAANNIIEEEKSKVEAILDSLGDGLMTVDSQYKVTYINRPAAELLGGKMQALSQQNGVAIFSIEDETKHLVPPAKNPITLAITKGKQVLVNLTKGPRYYLTARGRRRIALTVTPIKRGTEVAGAVIVFRDITEESNMDRAKSEIISIASHQLRTPLTTVKWYAEELISQTTVLSKPKQAAYLKQIYASNQHMIELVDALLNVSRIDLGTLALRPEQVEIEPMLEDTIRDLSMQIKNRHVGIKKIIDPELPPAWIDPNSLRTILQNLLSNAVKYSKEGQTVTVRIYHQGQHVLLEVEDTGCGIPKSEQGRIFTKLFRASNAQRIASDGTGLGLYIIKAMVEASGGRIWFESVENQGTTFHVIIPIEAK